MRVLALLPLLVAAMPAHGAPARPRSSSTIRETRLADLPDGLMPDGAEAPRSDELQAGSLGFSPDGKRLAYSARRGPKWLAVVDGKEVSASYPDVGGGAGVTWSPDGARFGYVAIRGGVQLPVVDGVEGKAAQSVGHITFGAGGRVAWPAFHDGKWHVVIDGREQGAWDG